MIIYICAFTDKGRQLAEQLNSMLSINSEVPYERRSADAYDTYYGCGKSTAIIRVRDGEKTEDFVADAFALRAPLIFIGATGIAVRMIAPFVKDKLTDPPVIVIDEKGNFVIPILSGHMGGANALANRLAALINATPVITTATDINGVFAVDVFARENKLKIVNREGIAVVSSKLLRGEEAYVCIKGGDVSSSICNGTVPWEDYINDIAAILPDGVRLLSYSEACKADIILEPKTLVVGIGCKKDTEPKKLEDFVGRYLGQLEADWSDVIAITSIDIKAKEAAIAELACKNGVDFVTFSAEELNAVQGAFSESDFVKEVTGVGSVCERSAAALARGDYEMLLSKTSEDGMTIAIARFAL